MNVAARLQAECPPGGICVSRQVRDHVQDRLDLAFEELGALKLKNIARPVEAFVLRRDVQVGPESQALDERRKPRVAPSWKVSKGRSVTAGRRTASGWPTGRLARDR